MEKVTFVQGYDIHERIGSGGFGVVHRAYQTTVGREVAIKIILPRFANDPEFIRRFELEAQLVARLEHLHIVPLYDYWRDPNGAYLVMRWMRGGSLRDALANGPYEPMAAARLIDQIASALSLAHRNGVIHRDLKPANILLDEDGNAYLSDFGIAKDIRRATDLQTGSGVIVGSPDYLAPEQARGDAITPQSDIYSLGVVLYEMLSGEHPFPNLTSVERMYRHLNEPLPLIEHVIPDSVERVNEIIQKATAKNPAQRYSNVMEMAAAFGEAVAPDSDDGSISLVEQLTLREHEILNLIVEGRTNREIAQELYVTLGTVKWHIRQIYQKLNVRSRVQAIVRARELELIVTHPEKTPSESRISQALPRPINPYKGLRAFQTVDARDFFGREALIQKLVDRLAETNRLSRFLAVVGPSGSGKSSVVKAGLVPALWRGDLCNSDRWFVVEMVPGAYPLDELEIALTRVAAEQGSNLRDNLTRDARGLVRVASLILPDDDSELVVIVDQLEEIFTLVEAEADRVHFLNLLHTAVTDSRSRVRVIVTLRADFYDRPLHYLDFGEMVRSRMETILPLSADELETAIIKPAEQAGVAFEPGLVARIISDVHYQPGALPLLQYALTELFEQRDDRLMTQDAYTALGGAVGALAKRADEVYCEQDSNGRQNIRQLFLRLVVPGEETVDTRRRVRRSELLDIASDEDVMDEIIDTYAAYRLLTLDHDPATRKPTVEVAHEAILHEWKRLQDWLNDSRHDMRQQRLLAAAAAEWQKAGQETSYLLHGVRLEQAEGWAARTQLALTQIERRYLEASIAENERQERVEHERQQRELDTQRALVDQQRRAANRLRYLVAALTLFLVVSVILTLIALGEQNNARMAWDSEMVARAAAEASLRRTDAQRLGLEASSLAEAGGDPDLLALLALRSLNTAYTPQGDIAIQRALLQSYPENVLHSPSDQDITDLSLSSDQAHLAVGRRDSMVEVWDVTAGDLIGAYEGGDYVLFMPDGERMVTVSSTGTLHAWNIRTRQQIALLEDLPGPIHALVALPGRDLLAISNHAGIVMLIDTNNWTEQQRFSAHDELIQGMAVSSDGNWLVTVSGDTEARLWYVDTLQRIRTFDHNGEWPQCVAISPDGRRFATGSAGGTLWLWSMDEADTPVQRVSAHAGGVTGVRFSPDGQSIATSGQDGKVRFWDTASVAEIRQPLIHPPVHIPDFEWAADGETLYVGTQSSIRVWDALRENNISHFAGSNHQNHFAFSPDGQQLAAIFIRSMTVYDLETGATTRFEHDVMLNAVAFSDDGRYLVFGAMSGEVFLWDVGQEHVVRSFKGLTAITPDLKISADNQLVAAGDFEGNLLVWDFATGEKLFSYHDGGAVAGLAFSPDSRLLLQSSRVTGARLWDTATWEVLWSMPLAPGWNDVAFTPDGHYFVIGGSGPVLSMWDVDLLAHVRDFAGHRGTIQTIDLSSDGRLLLSGSMDGSARLWDVETGIELRRIDVPNANYVDIAPDDQSLLVDNTRTASIWPLEIADARAYLCEHITRDFTAEERDFYEIGDLQPTCPRFAN